jgi:hypothetical protein
MILKGSQRGGPRQLAAHLLNLVDNDHVTLQELRGFVASDLTGAMTETAAIARGTACRQPIFSLSLNPPKDGQASVADLIAAADRAEAALGLDDQPRALVIHEKNGRRHAHVVWSRIDHDEMKAINLPFFKTKLKELSKELFLEHDWELPDGHRTNGWKNPLNFTLAEWQQAKRLGLDPREIKQVFQQAWARSDNLASFKTALEQHGYFLAKGDRRGFVALDLEGNSYSVSRWSGVKPRDLTNRLGDGQGLEGVEDTKARLRDALSARLRETMVQDKKARKERERPIREQLRMLVSHHRKERSILHDRQAARRADETRQRAARFRRGLGAVMDLLTGRLFTVRKQNEREAYDCHLRDKEQMERLVKQQLEERRNIQKQLDELAARQREERRWLVRRLIAFARPAYDQGRPRGLSL